MRSLFSADTYFFYTLWDFRGHGVFYVTGHPRYVIVTWKSILVNRYFSRFVFHFFMQLQVPVCTIRKEILKRVNNIVVETEQ